MAEVVGAYLFELAAAEVISWGTAAFISTYGSYVVLGSTLAYSASESRRMQAEAKDAAANAARDRTVTVTGSMVPRDLVLGRTRTGGANFYHAVTGADSSILYIAQALAGHQIDAVEQIYVNDEPVTLNSDGYATNAPYSLPVNATGTVAANEGGLATLPVTYVAETAFASLVSTSGTGRQGDRQVAADYPITVTGSGTYGDPYIAHTTPGALVTFNYTDYTTGSLRFAVHLGGADQVVDPWLHNEFPGAWPATNVVQGTAYLVARLVYDTNAFPSSVPSISARVRGALVNTFFPNINMTPVSAPQLNIAGTFGFVSRTISSPDSKFLYLIGDHRYPGSTNKIYGVNNKTGQLTYISDFSRDLNIKDISKGGETAYGSYLGQFALFDRNVQTGEITLTSSSGPQPSFFHPNLQYYYVYSSNTQLDCYSIISGVSSFIGSCVVPACNNNNGYYDFRFSLDGLNLYAVGYGVFLTLSINSGLLTVTNTYSINNYYYGALEVSSSGQVFAINNQGSAQIFNPIAQSVSVLESLSVSQISNSKNFIAICYLGYYFYTDVCIYAVKPNHLELVSFISLGIYTQYGVEIPKLTFSSNDEYLYIACPGERQVRVVKLKNVTLQWSENPALLMRHVYSHPRLGGATISDDEDARFAAAANACDTPTVYTVDGVPQPSRPLFTAGGVYRFDGSAPSNILNDLAQAMGGAWAFAGGEFYLRAGVYTAPVMTLTDADLAVIQRTGATESQSPIEVSVHRPTADMINTVKPIIYDSANDYKQTDLSDITSSALVERDGVVLSQSLQMLAVSYAPQAQHIAGIILRDGRDPLTVKAPFKMRAFPLEMFDCINLQLTELGINGTFLVVAPGFVQGVINLTLKETSAQITTLGADFLPQGYASNSNLPKPWEVSTIGALSVSSGGAEWLKVSGDGTVQSYMHVSWPTVTDVSVLQGGSIDLQYRLGTATEWSTLTIPGDSADALVGPVVDGNQYMLRARLCSSIFKGDWGILTRHTVSGKTDPPGPFDTFAVINQPDGTRQYNFGYTTSATPPDWLGAEIRYTTGAVNEPDWATMTQLQDGTSYYTTSPVELNAPQQGTYTFACKSLDSSGNESTALLQTITLPERRLANVFEWYDEAQEGWPGTKQDCFVAGTTLEAKGTTTWATGPATWAAWTRWNLAPHTPIIYTAPVRDLGATITARLDSTLDVAGTYIQELKTSQNGTTWSAWGSTGEAFTARYLQWRLIVQATASEPVAMVRSAAYKICAPMRTEFVNDLDISLLPANCRIAVGDVRLPVAGSYSVLKRTVVTPQDTRAGAWTCTRIDQLLSPGPRWQFRLDGVLTDPQFIDYSIEAF